MEEKRILSEEELEAIVGGAPSGGDMASWAWNAYNSGWQFVYGGSRAGAVDASGLIYSLVGGGCRTTEAMFANAPQKGPISSLPETPGLGLYMPGLVAVYVGGGMCICALNEDVGVTKMSVSAMPWSAWFEIPGVDY